MVIDELWISASVAVFGVSLLLWHLIQILRGK